MTNNLISIIVPAYNVSDKIKFTLNTLINQTYKNLEIIIVNDASTDNTLEVIMKLSSQDNRIKVINLQENVGVHEARMRGLRESNGNWIGFVDADDYVSLDMYQSMLDDARKNKVDIVICGVQRVDEEGNFLNKFIQEREGHE